MEWQTLPAEMPLDLRQDGDSEPGRERWHVASSGPPRLAHDHQLIRLAIPSRSNTSEGPPAILAALHRSGVQVLRGGLRGGRAGREDAPIIRYWWLHDVVDERARARTVVHAVLDQVTEGPLGKVRGCIGADPLHVACSFHPGLPIVGVECLKAVSGGANPAGSAVAAGGRLQRDATVTIATRGGGVAGEREVAGGFGSRRLIAGVCGVPVVVAPLRVDRRVIPLLSQG